MGLYVLGAFEVRNMLDSTAVVFWSDHGEMLGDKGRLAKSVFYEPAVRVPLILRPVGGLASGVESGALASIVDIFPTVLDLAGCEPKEDAFGRSLVPLIEGPGADHHDAVFSEFDHRTMVFDGRHKLVVRADGTPLKLFDLEADPTEAVNLLGREDTAETVARLRERLLAWLLATQAHDKRRAAPDV
jgi:arylsulfatase A-like enzyme